MIKRSGQRRELQTPVNNQAMSNDQLRRLVIEITNRTGDEAFVRRMLKLHDALKGGHFEKVSLIAGQSKNKSYQRVMATVSADVKQKRIRTALNIVFHASLYAYENSPDHGHEFMRYLERIRTESP